MILTDYYKMRVIKHNKTKRFDCIASTGEYVPFETMPPKGKTFFCYLCERGLPKTFSVPAQRRAGMAITNGKKSISGVYLDLNEPCKGFGDMQGTTDALLFQFNPDFTEMEIYVAREKKYYWRQLLTLFLAGDLASEIQTLQAAAKEVKPVF